MSSDRPKPAMSSGMSSAASAVSLGQLLRVLSPFHPVLHGDANTTVNDVVQDSRQVTAGTLFAARKGESADGTRFIPQAVARGAAALLAERGGLEYPASFSVPLLEVDSVPRALALSAEAIHGFPSRQLKLVGVTGTNGKTTCASLLTQCLRALGYTTGQLGTLGLDVRGPTPTLQDICESGSLTTPEADAISRALSGARQRGASHFVMEVSSHAIAKERVSALNFEVAAFTNLSQDHLDFHASMAEYGETKARLFIELGPKHCVINIDDDFGRQLAARAPGALTVGRCADARLRLVKQHHTDRSTELTVVGQDQTLANGLRFQTGVLGAHNAENWLVTLGILQALGVDLRKVADIAPMIHAAPGRLERCDTEQDEVSVYVDYAHTPDALARALQACRSLTSGELWCVFGCGGDRDRKKRPLMAEAVKGWADKIVVTSDNPRTEDPEHIIREIQTGLVGVEHETYVDRSEAIAFAVSHAAAKDLILIAGKGHEDYQILGTHKIHFDDREQASRALAARRQRETA